MTVDAKIVAVGGGSYDLDLVDNGYGLDLQVIGGDAATHNAATAQRLTYEFGVWLGESPFDRSAGFPWEQAVFGSQPIEGIPDLVYLYALQVEGVDDIASNPELYFDAELRRLRLDMPRVQGADFVVEGLTQLIQG